MLPKMIPRSSPEEIRLVLVDSMVLEKSALSSIKILPIMIS